MASSVMSSGPSMGVHNENNGSSVRGGVEIAGVPFYSAAIGHRGCILHSTPAIPSDYHDEGQGQRVVQETALPHDIPWNADSQTVGLPYLQSPLRKRQRKSRQDASHRDRSSNWSYEETDLLFRCRKELLLTTNESQECKGAAAWRKISETISGKSSLQCQRRWDTLKKAMWDIRDYCLQHNIIPSQLQEPDFAKLRLATAYSRDWCQYIDEFCNATKRRPRKDGLQEGFIVSQDAFQTSSPQPSPYHHQVSGVLREGPEVVSSLPCLAAPGCLQVSQNLPFQFPKGQEAIPEYDTLSEFCNATKRRPQKDRLQEGIRVSQDAFQASSPQPSPPHQFSGVLKEGPEVVSSLPCLAAPECLQVSQNTLVHFPEGQKAIPEYDTVSEFVKEILLDMLLCSPWCMKGELPKHVTLKEVSLWLAIVHGRDTVDIMYILQEFHVKSRLVPNERQSMDIISPEGRLENLPLYLEFAYYKVHQMPKWLESRLVVFDQHYSLGNLRAGLAIHETANIIHLCRCQNIPSINLGTLTNLRSLSIEYCSDLQHVGGWEHLDQLGWLTWRHSCVYSFPGTIHLTALQYLELEGDSTYSSNISSPPDLSQCRQLRTLIMKWYPMLVAVPDLKRLKQLQRLIINGCKNILEAHLSLSALTSLVTLDFRDCNQLAALPDLSNLLSLQYLDLSYTQICEIQGLGGLKQLKKLDCDYSKLSWLPDLHGLAFLEVVYVRGTGIRMESVLCNNGVRVGTGSNESRVCKADIIPEFDSFPEITKWILLDLILCWPGGGTLNSLELIDVSRWLSLIHDMDSEEIMHICQQLGSKSILESYGEDKVVSTHKRFNHPYKYEEFALHEVRAITLWAESRMVVKDENSLKVFGEDIQLETLQVLKLSSCPSLIKINLERLTNLRSFSIEDCDKLQEVRGWAKLKTLGFIGWNGPHNSSLLDTRHLTSLQYLVLEGHLRQEHWSMPLSLSDLSNCIHLCSLKLRGCVGLQETPDLTNLKHLQRLEIEGRIPQIHSSLSELTALRHLRLRRVGSPESPLPSLSRLCHLQSLELFRMVGFESIPGVEMLVKLRKLRCDWVYIRWLPDLSHLSFLEGIQLVGTFIRGNASVCCDHNQVKVRVYNSLSVKP